MRAVVVPAAPALLPGIGGAADPLADLRERARALVADTMTKGVTRLVVIGSARSTTTWPSDAPSGAARFTTGRLPEGALPTALEIGRRFAPPQGANRSCSRSPPTPTRPTVSSWAARSPTRKRSSSSSPTGRPPSPRRRRATCNRTRPPSPMRWAGHSRQPTRPRSPTSTRPPATGCGCAGALRCRFWPAPSPVSGCTAKCSRRSPPSACSTSSPAGAGNSMSA